MGATLLTTMMIYAGFSQFFIDNLLNSIDANDFITAAIIILSLIFITFVSSLFISILVATGIDRGRAMFASIGAYVSTFLFIVGLCMAVIYIRYPSLVYGLDLGGVEYFLVFPMLSLFYVGVYVMDQFFYLIVVIIVLYYFIYVMLLWIMESRDNRDYYNR